jgi:UDP-hydrolysing UDP-N-acetyl-D-glucosamine 2-epimerase
MGEEAWRIHPVGEPSLDLLNEIEWPEDAELQRRLGLDEGPWQAPIVVTLHPATMHLDEVGLQARNLIDALSRVEGRVVITSANQDPGGMAINEAMRAFASSRPDTWFFESLGWENYAALMRRSRVMVGNSSSGLLEAPSFELPVVNIGDRQGGRLRAANVIDVADDPHAIEAGIARACDPQFRDALRGLVNPYGNGQTGALIADVLEQLTLDESIRIKRFVEAFS